jgi:hypothetical protein
VRRIGAELVVERPGLLLVAALSHDLLAADLCVDEASIATVWRLPDAQA